MQKETWEVLIDCGDCGIPVDVDLEHGYRVADDLAVCWACATRRGALFDEAEDIWLAPPDLTGLCPDVDHKVA